MLARFLLRQRVVLEKLSYIWVIAVHRYTLSPSSRNKTPALVNRNRLTTAGRYRWMSSSLIYSFPCFQSFASLHTFRAMILLPLPIRALGPARACHLATQLIHRGTVRPGETASGAALVAFDVRPRRHLFIPSTLWKVCTSARAVTASLASAGFEVVNR